MAECYVRNGDGFLKLQYANLRYWDGVSFKAPSQMCWYDGSSWIPLILTPPPVGTVLSGGGSGKVYYYELSPGQSSTYYVDLLDMITNAGYDAAATKASGGNVTLQMFRDWSMLSAEFHIGLYKVDNSGARYIAGTGSLVARGNPFSITLPKSEMANGMYFRWTSHNSDHTNTGWVFPLYGSFTLNF